MSLLSKIRGRPDEQAVEPDVHECLHASLLPHWAEADDMGHEDRAISWTCTSCDMTFTPEERAELLRTEADRLRRTVGAG